MTETVGQLAHLPPGASPRLSRLPAPAAPSRPGLDFKWLLVGGPAALVVWLSLVPLTFLLWQSFLTPQTATVPARYTLDNFRTAYFSAETFRLFFNSIELFQWAQVGTEMIVMFVMVLLVERVSILARSRIGA